MGVPRPDELDKTIYNVLIDHRFAMSEVVIPTRVGVDLVPANIDLAGAEVQLVSEFGREAILKEKLAPLLRSYDFVIIDCPPSLGLLSINAMVAAGEVIIPLQCEYFAMKGMQLLFETIDKVRAKLNPKLRISGILPTIFKGRTLHSQEVLGLVQSRYGDLLYPVTIKDSIRFAESPVVGMSILEYAPASDGARSYQNLAVEVLNHG
jgi:chromosome partitioning protein